MAHLVDQFIHIFHYMFSLFLLLILAPRLFFQKQYEGAVEQIIPNLIKMVFILLALGYILAIFRLFELLSVCFLLIMIGSRLHRIRKKGEIIEDHILNTEAMIYDYFEGKYKLKQVLAFYSAQQYQQYKAFVQERFSTPVRMVGTVSLLSVLCFAFYIRFYDAIVHSAPSFLNQYTTLKWVKDIRQNLLFSDGIVPQGFHVFWAVIQEFSRIDTLYMTKYSGPFMQVLIMFGIYVVLSRLTGSRLSGVVGLTVYAFGGEYADPYFWEWQVAAAPGPFAHIFFLSTFYYLVLYLRSAHQDALYTMFAGMGIIAFVQPAVFLFELLILISMVSLWFVVFKLKREIASIPRVITLWGMAGVLSLAPVIVGLIAQRDSNFSFNRFLQIETEKSFYLLPYPSFAPMLLSLMIGFLWYIIFKRFRACRYQSIVEMCLLGALITAISFTTLQPVEPMKVDWDSSVAQYSAISKEFSPRNWMIVSKQEFSSVVQGRGYHLNIEELVISYDPSQKSLTLYGFNEPDLNLPPHIFIYYEKSLRQIHLERVKKRLESDYDRWYLRNQDLKLWLEQYMVAHPEVEVYYEDEHLIIYHLEREQKRVEILEKIRDGVE